MQIGVIADDLTGATDIAGFLANNGLETIQIMGIPEPGFQTDADAVVVSLKSRSIAPEDAVRQSLAALDSLRRAGCVQYYFKYCSTFDSTKRGNIGPVTDALLESLESDFTVICPSLPVNGRTVEGGVLYVNGVPLAESGMRHHPINPMTDSDLTRLMEMQSRGRAMVLDLATVEKGAAAVREGLAALRAKGCRYAVLDAATDAHLDILAEALDDVLLLTGGSGLGAARARVLSARFGGNSDLARQAGRPSGGRVVALSGSCSEMTNRQVAAYREKAESVKAVAARCIADPDAYAEELAAWVDANAGGDCAPLVYATVGKDELAAIQKEFGVEETSRAVEEMFTKLAGNLLRRGFDTFIVAGGETSGAVTGALGETAFRLGPEIAPGVPWIRAVDGRLSLALKSGNFGDEGFFCKAQEFIA